MYYFLSEVYMRLFAHPVGVPRVGEHHWQDLGHKTIFLFLIYPTAILVAKRTGELKPGALFGILTFIYVIIWFYIMHILDQLLTRGDEEKVLSVGGLLGYEYWPYTVAQFLSSTVLPVLILLLLNHLTRRISRTRQAAPLN